MVLQTARPLRSVPGPLRSLLLRPRPEASSFPGSPSLSISSPLPYLLPLSSCPPTSSGAESKCGGDTYFSALSLDSPLPTSTGQLRRGEEPQPQQCLPAGPVKAGSLGEWGSLPGAEERGHGGRGGAGRESPLLRPAAGPSPIPLESRGEGPRSRGQWPVGRRPGPRVPRVRDGAQGAPLPSSVIIHLGAHVSLSHCLLSCLFPPLPSLPLEGSSPSVWSQVPSVDGGFVQGSPCPKPMVSKEPCPAPPFLGPGPPPDPLYVWGPRSRNHSCPCQVVCMRVPCI